MRDPIRFDPAIPPEGATDAELLLWAGRCPWCAQRSSFSPDEGAGDAWTCLWCGCRFEGPDEQVRVITALRREGDPAKRSDPAVDLPDLQEILVGTAVLVPVMPSFSALVGLRLSVAAGAYEVQSTPTLAGQVKLRLGVSEELEFSRKPVFAGIVTMGA